MSAPAFLAPDALAGRTAVVTGGSSGIGLATVEVLLAAGAAVALCGRNAERLDGAVPVEWNNGLSPSRMDGPGWNSSR